MNMNLVYLYLLSPLHTGGTTQEGNLLGIARESHTDLPYIPSSTIRGRLRASVSPSAEEFEPNEESAETDSVNTDDEENSLAGDASEVKRKCSPEWIVEKLKQISLFGSEIDDSKNKDLAQAYKKAKGKNLDQLVQGDIWIGDSSILWLPVPSLSYGMVWITCPLLLQRWARLSGETTPIPEDDEHYYVTPDLAKGKPIYLKDCILEAEHLTLWEDWNKFIPKADYTRSISKVILLPNQDCATLIQMSLWRQVKVKLDEHKSVKDGSFRYEEAISPDTLMYFSWGVTSQVNGSSNQSETDFKELLEQQDVVQIGGQESLGRGFVNIWAAS